MTKFVTILMTVGILAGCAGRDPNMMASMQTEDKNLVCADMEKEYSNNHNVALVKIKANETDDDKDLILGGVGVLLFFPVLFALDTKNADGNEGNSLIDRNEHLVKLANDKGCTTASWPPLPKKYS